MSDLIIMRGVSGSGKSTIAKSLRNPATSVVVNRDTIRKALFGSEEDFGIDEELVTLIQDATIDYALSLGYDVVVDNTNVHWPFVEALAEIGYRRGANVTLHTVDVDIDTALMRNWVRHLNGGRFVPERVIHNQYNSLHKTKDNTL